VGGHAYLICGANREMRCPDGTLGALRMQNSWGQSWGDGGQAWISYMDAATLLKDWGEAATSAELFAMGDK
jgi:C1A family cysteine protease